MEKRRPSGTPGSSGPLGQPSQPRFECRRFSYQNQLAQKRFLSKFPKFPRESMGFQELCRSNGKRKNHRISLKISESVQMVGTSPSSPKNGRNRIVLGGFEDFSYFLFRFQRMCRPKTVRKFVHPRSVQYHKLQGDEVSLASSLSRHISQLKTARPRLDESRVSA